MRSSLSHKLTISILSLCILCTVLIWLSTRFFFQSYFVDYINQQQQDRMSYYADTLSSQYSEQQNWNWLRQNSNRWFEVVGGPRGPRSPGRPPTSPPILEGEQRGMGLIDSEGRVIYGDRNFFENQNLIHHPVYSEEDLIGYLVAVKQTEVTTSIDQNFAQSLNRSMQWALVMVVGLSILVSIVLARSLSKPVKNLSRTTRRLTEGQYHERIASNRSDEIGQLSSDLNTLAKTLDANKSSQQRWIADISHELRTPIGVLKGELMAIEDGVRKFDSAALSSLIGETERFNRMVNDLYDLSRADAGDLDYQMEPMELGQLIEETVEQYQLRFSQKGLKLSCLKTEGIKINADQGRINQLLSNLLENSLRYTDSGGEVLIQCQIQSDRIELSVEDSLPGIPDDSYEKIFERLYRVEGSRSRKFGGGGLGLALCKAITEAHQGKISAAQSTQLGGVKITVSLPLSLST